MRDIGEERSLGRLGLLKWERTGWEVEQEESAGEVAEVEKTHALTERGPQKNYTSEARRLQGFH